MEKAEAKEKKKKKNKEKGMLQKISEKLSGDPDPDDMVLDTLGELKEVVGSMRDVFEDFDEGYSKQLEEERSAWQKVESKLPKFLQSSNTKSQEHRVGRIKNNKKNLSELEESLSKLELILSSSNSSIDAMSKAYVKTASSGRKEKEGIKELEARMEKMQEDLAAAMGEMTAQITLIKAALDNMAGQLDEQGVKLTGIDTKIDTIDTKLDKAHEMLQKISKKITNNRLIVLAVIGAAAAFIATTMTG